MNDVFDFYIECFKSIWNACMTNFLMAGAVLGSVLTALVFFVRNLKDSSK